MLKMILIFPFLLLLICSARAQKEIISLNQVEAAALSEDAMAEGRACSGCGGSRACSGCGGDKTHIPDHPDHTIHDLLYGIHDLVPSHHDLLTLIIMKLPVLAFNILGIVLLVLLLKKLFIDDSEPAYADTGLHAYADTGLHYSAPSSYAEPLTYNKRSSVGSPSSWSLQNIWESTQFVMDSIDKHNFIENQ